MPLIFRLNGAEFIIRGKTKTALYKVIRDVVWKES